MAVTKDMTIGEVLLQCEKAPEVLMGIGMHCLCCPSSQGETIEEAAMVHGVDVDELVNMLNA